MKMTLTHKTVRQIIETLRDASDRLETCADDYNGDARDDLMKGMADCEQLAAKLEAKLNPIEA